MGFLLLDLQFYAQCYVDRYMFFCLFSFGHCIVCPSLIYGFVFTPLVSSNS